jgi:enoyl-CoA hydratase
MAGRHSLVVDEPARGVARLRLDRPQTRNALDRSLVSALLEAFGSLDAAAVVLGSTDPTAFCSGADLSIDDAERAEVSELLYDLYETMVRLPAPIVVATGGHAVGGGAQLLLAGDLRVGGPTTRIRFVGPGHGLAVGTWGLPSLVGRGRAMDLCLTMRAVGAEEAIRIGLLDRIEEDPEAAAVLIAGELAGLDGEAVERLKRIVADRAGLLEALDRERIANRGWSGAIGKARPDG